MTLSCASFNRTEAKAYARHNLKLAGARSAA